jgi:hypothetical protein
MRKKGRRIVSVVDFVSEGGSGCAKKDYPGSTESARMRRLERLSRRGNRHGMCVCTLYELYLQSRARPVAHVRSNDVWQWESSYTFRPWPLQRRRPRCRVAVADQRRRLRRRVPTGLVASSYSGAARRRRPMASAAGKGSRETASY